MILLHLSKHIASDFCKQVEHIPKETLIAKLKKHSFFNPSWSKEEIIEGVAEAYNFFKNKGLTGSHLYKFKGEHIKVFIKADGTLDTAFGSHLLNLDYFL